MDPGGGPSSTAVVAQSTTDGTFSATINAQGKSTSGDDWQARGITFDFSGGGGGIAADADMLMGAPDGTCYYMSPPEQSATWYDARDTCAGMGGALVSIDSAWELNLVVQHLNTD